MSGTFASVLIALIAGGGLLGPTADRDERAPAATPPASPPSLIERPAEASEPVLPEAIQPAAVPEDLPVANEICIQQMAGFPDSSPQARYQFYRLVQASAVGADAGLLDALAAYGGGGISADTPMIETVEEIANPVMRQAAPQLIVAQMAHLIGFAQDCAPYIDGQVRAYVATDPGLADPQYNREIGEDALFLRSVLLDTLYRLEADADPHFGAAVSRYQRSIVTQRDEIEFAAFDSELAELEAIALGDLGDRLDMANASVNDTLDQGQLDAAIGLSRDMSEAYQRESRARMAQVFIEILGRY